jgi:hypothetical protein
MVRTMAGSLAPILLASLVAVLAFACFGPSAWQACSAGFIPMTSVVERSAEAKPAAALTLRDWHETYNPTNAQVAQLDTFFVQQRNQYIQTFNNQTALALAYFHSHYIGQRLDTYLHLLYKNQELNNIAFTSYRLSLVNSLFVNGVVSSTPYTFYNLL